MATWTWRDDINGSSSADKWPGDSGSPTYTTLSASVLNAARGLRYAQNADAESTFVAPSKSSFRGTSLLVIEVKGTSVGTSDELVITNLPPFITLYGARFHGSVSVDPSLGRVASFTLGSFDQLTDNVTPGTWVDLASASEIRTMFLPDGKLVVRPKPSSSATVQFELLIGCGV